MITNQHGYTLVTLAKETGCRSLRRTSLTGELPTNTFNMPKETYKERNGTTRVGDALRWLAGNGRKIAPGVLDLAGNITGIDAFNKLASAIGGDAALSAQDKEFLLRQLDADMTENIEVSKRWSSDMASDSWLSKNVRPLSLIFLTVFTMLLIYLDFFDSGIQVPSEWIDLLKSLLLGVYVAYFGSRGIEKYKSMK